MDFGFFSKNKLDGDMMFLKWVLIVIFNLIIVKLGIFKFY